MLPNDITRCADGEKYCPRAKQCARTEWPSDAAVPVAALWMEAGCLDSIAGQEVCRFFVPKTA